MISRYIFHVPMCATLPTFIIYYDTEKTHSIRFYIIWLWGGYFVQLINIILCHSNDK